VFLLSIQLRRRELETMAKIGAARASVATLLASEIVFVAALGVALAAGLTALTSRFGAELIRAFLLA
jgi:putative ABC transport system permease protein